MPGWREWQSAVSAPEILSCHHRKLCDKAEGACDHFHSFYFRDLRHVSCIPYLPTFCPLSSSCSYFCFLSFEQSRVQNCRLMQTERERWDNGVWPCFPLRRWIVCISAVYHCHLNLALLAYSWHLKPSTLINIYPSSALGWSAELGLAWTVNTATWEGQWIPVSPGMSLGSWHWPLSAHLQRLLPDFKAELQVISGTWQKHRL